MRIITLLIVLITSAAVSAQQNPLDRDAKNATRGDGVMKLVRFSVHDPGINNIEAVSFLVPKGWQTDAGVKWFHDYSILANLQMRITDPASGAQVQTLPIQNFIWMNRPVIQMKNGQNYMGNICWPPVTDLTKFVETFYVPDSLRHLKNARLSSTELLPKVAEAVAAQYGGQSKVVAGRLRYDYESNGQPWQEDVYLTLVFSEFPDCVVWTVRTAHSFRAPRGRLDAITPTLATCIQTMRINPEWYYGYAYVQQLFSQRMYQGIRDAGKISETITRNSEQIRKMYAESYRKSSESQDRINQSYSESLRGVETYQDPFAGKPVELPSGYNDAWVNARGEYILSSQGGFDPNVGDTVEWRRMPRRTD